MECTLCSKQYTGKFETQFNIRLNPHQKAIYKLISLELDQHFKPPNREFSRHAQFTPIEQLDNLNIDKDLAAFIIEKRDFSMLKLITVLRKPLQICLFSTESLVELFKLFN